MKKLSVVLIMLVGGIAFASSLSIPWYVDGAPVNTGLPPTQDGAFSLIYLKSTVDTVLTCEIAYYNANGDFLGPQAPNNTFTIAPKSALGFRPVANDPNGTLPGGTAGGQEGAQGVLVPNRPKSVDASTPIPGTTVIDQKKNGSITIQWTGDATDVQGSQQAWAKGGATVVSFSHLLPPGK
jgi:hypothetical protein